jgi:hypothetical protein
MALLGFAGGTAFTGQPLLALGVSMGLATVVGLAADVVRRLRRPSAVPAPVVPPPPPVRVPVGAGRR